MHKKTLAVLTLASLALAGCGTREKPAAIKPMISPADSVTVQGTPPITATVPMMERDAASKTFSSFDRVPNAKREIGPGGIIFNDADVRQVFELYQEVSGRSLIYSGQVPKNAKVTFRNATALTRAETLQALDTILAAHGIVMVYNGTQFVKVCAAAEAPTEVPPSLDTPWRELPDSSSFLSYTVGLKYMDVREAMGALQPLARLPNSIIANVQNNSLMLRDYSSNVRRMLEVLERLDTAAAHEPPPTRLK